MRGFQNNVRKWVTETFGPEVAANKIERNHRFLEEALELVQAGGCTKEEALQLVDYVYGRPEGEIEQEVGGVANTLAALCNAHGIDLFNAANKEMDRCWERMDKIRAKHLSKPRFSPLPGSYQ